MLHSAGDPWPGLLRRRQLRHCRQALCGATSCPEQRSPPWAGCCPGALLFIGKDFPGLTSFDKELLTSILLIGALIGTLAVGKIADRIGRRPTVLGTAALFVGGVMLAAFSPSFGVLVAARVIIGLAVGSASMVVPLYIGEVVPPQIRGALVSFNQLAITSGILVS